MFVVLLVAVRRLLARIRRRHYQSRRVVVDGWGRCSRHHHVRCAVHVEPRLNQIARFLLLVSKPLVGCSHLVTPVLHVVAMEQLPPFVRSCAFDPLHTSDSIPGLVSYFPMRLVL